MYIAIDENDVRIDVNNAEKGQKYFCPICRSPLIIKDGEINAKHYAHKAGNCADDWDYDMSEWHRRMQDYFSLENREVVLEHDGKIHRADVMINDYVIEFQHSPISLFEFRERNAFFRRLGKKIAWVFDLSEQYEDRRITYSYNNDNLLRWTYPFRIFSVCGEITDDSKDFALWFYLSPDDGDYISKVIWTVTDNTGRPSLSRFVISEYGLEMDNNIDPAKFFRSKKDYFREALSELKSKFQYYIKYSGVYGMSRESYYCPKKDPKQRIKVYSESGCVYCKYCYMIAKQRYGAQYKFAVYCCYPNQVREKCCDIESYEYGEAYQFYL